MMTSGEQPDQLRIGELARCAGVTSRAIRHYHATGLLPEPPRDASGYRRYRPSDLVRLVHICRLRALGMPIDQIGKALEETPDAGADLAAALLALAVDVDAEIDRLQGVHDRLITLAESDALDDAGDLLTAGLRARGLLDPALTPRNRAESPPAPLYGSDTVPVTGPFQEDPSATARFHELLQRFRTVTHDQVEALAQDFAAIIPTLGHPGRAVDLPMMDRLLGERLSHGQRDCMIRLRALLQAPSPATGLRATVR
jgi:DNA-binding transcriptional MerR regulator